MMKMARQQPVATRPQPSSSSSSSSASAAAISGSQAQYAKLVQTALLELKKGDHRGYNFVVQNLSPAGTREQHDKPITIPLVWLHALTQSASMIKPQDCETLLRILYAFDWAADQEIVSAYANLLINLISSDVAHIAPSFQMIARNFYPRKNFNPLVDEKYDLVATEVVAKHLHQTVKMIIDLVPSSTSVWLDILENNFPHKRLDVETHRSYLSNLIRVTSYCEALKSPILGLAIKNILQIDVEIKIEVLEEDDEDDIFDMEMTEHAADMATKLDALMDILFTFLFRESQKSISHQEQLFLMLLQLFDTFILKTHKSKYVQFLLFYMCAMNVNYTHAFVRYLSEKVLDVSIHALTRSTCAAYLGSFLARSTIVPVALVKDALLLLTSWIKHYGTQNRDIMPDAELHGLFYAVCQAVFYVICFKYKALDLQTPEGSQFFAELGINEIIQYRLNPLKMCAATVVTEFIKIAADMCGLLPSCREVLERNKRIVLPSKSAFGNANQLDSFFPFDPYLLRHSSKHITSIYQTWSPAPTATATTSTPSSSPATPNRTAAISTGVASPSALPRSVAADAFPPSSPHVALTFLSSIPSTSVGSFTDTPPSPGTFHRFRADSASGEDLMGGNSYVGSPSASMLSMTPDSVSNDVDFSWKYSWGGK